MFAPFTDRLIAISDMLNSPHEEIREEAYDLLFNLWVEYFLNSDFGSEIERVANDHPVLKREFEDRINKSSRLDEEKIKLLENIRFLYSFEVPKESQPFKQTSEKKIQETDTNFASVDKTINNEFNLRAKRKFQLETSISGAAASWVAVLISFAVLIGGLSAGYSSSLGIIFSLTLTAAAIFVFIYNIIEKDK